MVWLRGANGQGKTSCCAPWRDSRLRTGSILWGATRTTLPSVYIAHANALKEDLSAAESLRFLVPVVRARPERRRSVPRSRTSPWPVAARPGTRASRKGCDGGSRWPGWRSRRRSSWVLDEPFDALDAAGIETLDALLRNHANAAAAWC